jgi:magnesium transporter
MVGIVTVDDIVDVVEEETTEDIQKYGGMEALEEPYLRIGFADLMRKRAPWLSILFIGEMFTTFAMSRFEGQIAEAVFLVSFVPLIISSGGNSGSQASTLVIRAMTLGEVKLRDWWRVIRREFFAGALLGTILGSLGILRVVIWQMIKPTDYNGVNVEGLNTIGMSATVFVSLLGVVMFGTIAGSTLPLLLRRLNFDPASASAPFVATLVDVMGVLIYFITATVLILN